MATVLVIGGAGYIGSHMTEMLMCGGHRVVVLDNGSTGFFEAVLSAELIVGDLADQRLLDEIFSKYHFDAVMHFAGFIQVGESVKDPAKYYRNNVTNVVDLLDVMLRHQVKKLIFSSSAAIYGEPQYTPIDDQHPKNPVNPYGRTKWMLEQILQDYDHAYGLCSISLRYFNAAGADPEGRLGERHDPETHLIPLVLQVASGRRPSIDIYGTDYDTQDGTCVRDYIHVFDLCKAHLLALDALLQGAGTNTYNLGNGQGFSVLEVIETAREVTKKPIVAIECARRAGDPAVLVADASRIQTELNWQPKITELKTIIQHAWVWEQFLCQREE